MGKKSKGLMEGCVGLLLAVALPSHAQKMSCNSSPNAAVQCFVKNAVNSGLATPPPGMTLPQYMGYGVAVSNVVQTPPTLVFALGTMGAVADALPPINRDGVTPNQAAQDTAVNAIVEAALKNGLISLPADTTADQLKMFARDTCAAMAHNTGVMLSPGVLLRALDSFLINATVEGGTVDWSKVKAGISSLVDGFVLAGLLKMPAGFTTFQVKQFAYDVTVAIYNYKLATGKTAL